MQNSGAARNLGCPKSYRKETVRIAICSFMGNAVLPSTYALECNNMGVPHVQPCHDLSRQDEIARRACFEKSRMEIPLAKSQPRWKFIFN